MRRTLLLCLMSCVAVAASGCAYNSWVLAPFGPGTLCDSSGGGEYGPAAIAPSFEPACAHCGAASGGAGGESCDTAGGQYAEASHAAVYPPGPLTWVFAILAQGYHGPTSGEIWWGDWHGAPPDCSDPCDRHGEYTGPGASDCESCDTGYAGEVRQVGPTHVAGRHGNGSPAGRRVGAKPTGGQIAGASSKYAPRLISVTDRAVDTNQPGSVPQATLPRRMPAHQ